MYNNYIFDLYGTLIEIETDEEDSLLWEKVSMYFGYYGANYEPEDFKKRFYKLINKSVDQDSKIKYPEVNIDDVFYKLFKDKGVKPKKKLTKNAALLFRLLSTKKIKLYDGVLETLKELKKQDKKLYIIGNGQSVFAKYEMQLLGIYDLFDGIYMSSNYGVKKPDIKIFETITEVEKIKKKETILIGNDYEEDIKFANDIGIDSLYIKTNMSNLYKIKVESKYEIVDENISKILDLLK